jgi:molecular chaperone GrpE
VSDKKGTSGDDDDSYVIEDTGDTTIEQIEHEMEMAAKQAAGDPPAQQQPAQASAAADAAGSDEFKDRYLRTLADFENFRKRADREKSDFYKYALQGVLKDLLPILDNFDRALDHAEQGDDFHKGVLLIYKQLLDVLKKHGVKPIDESGVRFDPNIHEAVISEEDPSIPSQTVTMVLQKGYFLHDRLLRPAMVKVAVGGAEQG